MSSYSFPCPSSDLAGPCSAPRRRFSRDSYPAARCELPPSRKKRNKEWRRIISLRREDRRSDVLSRNTGSVEPLPRRIFMGHWRFVTITEQARRTTIGHEVAAVVSRCTERRLGKKKYPKSFFNFMELLKGEHLKSVSEWLLPLREKDFGEDGLPLSYRSKWFKKEMHVRKEGSKVVEYPVYFPKIPLWMLRFGHERHYHAEQWIPNGDVETELDHIHKYLDGHFAIDLLKGRFFADRVYDLNLIKKSALERIIRKETMEEALAPLV